MNPLDQLISEIEKLKGKHVFQLFNAKTDKKISKGYAGKYNNQSIYDYETDILNKHGSVTDLFKHIKRNGHEAVRIEFRRKNGSRTFKTDINPITVHLGTQEQKPQQGMSETQTPTTTQQQQPVVPAQPNYAQPGLAGGMVPLGVPQYMDFVKKEERLALIEKANEKLETENTELKADKRKLQIKLDEAKSKCTLADERLILEKDKIESNRKDWMESPFALKLAESAPQLLAMFAPQAGAAQPAQGLSGGHVEGYDQATDMQKQLVAVILQAAPSDEMTMSLYTIIDAVIKNPSLIVQINQFIQPQNQEAS